MWWNMNPSFWARLWLLHRNQEDTETTCFNIVNTDTDKNALKINKFFSKHLQLIYFWNKPIYIFFTLLQTYSFKIYLYIKNKTIRYQINFKVYFLGITPSANTSFWSISIWRLPNETKFNFWTVQILKRKIRLILLKNGKNQSNLFLIPKFHCVFFNGSGSVKCLNYCIPCCLYVAGSILACYRCDKFDHHGNCPEIILENRHFVKPSQKCTSLDSYMFSHWADRQDCHALVITIIYSSIWQIVYAIEQ